MRYVFLALLCASVPAAAQLQNPTVKVEPGAFAETRHGVATSDPYRWMEDPKRAADMTAFVRTMSDATVAQLRQLPRRAAYAKTLEAAYRAGVRFSDVRAAGDRLVYRRIVPGDRTSKLVVREGGTERLLFDPGAGGANAAIGAWSLSPDGGIAAIHVSEKGGEVGAIRFLDTGNGKEIAKRIEPAWGELNVAWLTPTRIAYTLMRPELGDPVQNMRTFVADLNGEAAPVAVLGVGIEGSPAIDPAEFPQIDEESRGGWMIGVAGGARADSRYFVTRRADLAAGKPAWRTISTLEDRVADVEVRGDSLWLLTTKDASNGRIERMDPASGKRERVATPEGLVLTDLHAAEDGVYISAQRDGASRLLYLADGRTPAREIPLPFEARIVGARPAADGRGVLFTLMGWTTAPRSFRAEGGRLAPLGLDSVGWAAARDFQVLREEAVSADGTRVPLVVITPKGQGPWPTFLEAYGAYGIAMAAPLYIPYMLAWTGEGGAAAYCGARGGNERGRAWHDGGRERNKPNAQADYIACAEKLVAMGVAKPGGIAATGGSAGGALGPVSAQKRPDLFGALLPRVGILNPSRLEAAANGPNQYDEMGDPRTADGYRALVAQDAYLSLATAKDLPDTLVTIGLNDRRVAPWMSAKFAAAARDRFGAKRLVLVRADTEQGHGIGSTVDALINEWADIFAFLNDRLAANAQ